MFGTSIITVCCLISGSSAWSELRPALAKLERATQANDVGLVVSVLRQLVVGYEPADEIVDWITVVRRAGG